MSARYAGTVITENADDAMADRRPREDPSIIQLAGAALVCGGVLAASGTAPRPAGHAPPAAAGQSP